MPGTCKTCKYWAWWDGQSGECAVVGEKEFLASFVVRRRCSDGFGFEPISNPESYHAALVTDDDFGCVHHEPKT